MCGKFLYIKLIIFVEVGLIVLKGVVIFGYKFFFIGFWIFYLMFGIVISKLFIDGYYLFEKKFCILSGIMCRDIFYKYIESDELVEYGCM